MASGNKPEITPEGTIRTPSGTSESMHEFKVISNRVLYRWIQPDGAKLDGDQSDWIVLNASQVSGHYFNGPPLLRTWFNENGFTKDRIESDAEAAKPIRQRGRRKK